jgi:hypothetical protein
LNGFSIKGKGEAMKRYMLFLTMLCLGSFFYYEHIFCMTEKYEKEIKAGFEELSASDKQIIADVIESLKEFDFNVMRRQINKFKEEVIRIKGILPTASMVFAGRYFDGALDLFADALEKLNKKDFSGLKSDVSRALFHHISFLVSDTMLVGHRQGWYIGPTSRQEKFFDSLTKNSNNAIKDLFKSLDQFLNRLDLNGSKKDLEKIKNGLAASKAANVSYVIGHLDKVLKSIAAAQKYLNNNDFSGAISYIKNAIALLEKYQEKA